jgi:hypothetical protein
MLLRGAECYHERAGAADDDDDTVVHDARLSVTEPAQRVFMSMREVEAFWDAQARHISNVCSVDMGLARYLLKEHGHETDRAIQAYLLHVRPQLERSCTPRLALAAWIAIM